MCDKRPTARLKISAAALSWISLPRGRIAPVQDFTHSLQTFPELTAAVFLHTQPEFALPQSEFLVHWPQKAPQNTTEIISILVVFQVQPPV